MAEQTDTPNTLAADDGPWNGDRLRALADLVDADIVSFDPDVTDLEGDDEKRVNILWGFSLSNAQFTKWVETPS